MTQPQSIRLTFIPATERATPAHTGDISRSATNSLRNEGYDIQPAYTGERGGSAYDVLMAAAQAVHDNQEMLKALVVFATPIVKYLLDWYQKQNVPTVDPSQLFEVTVTIDHVTVTARLPAEANDDALLKQLLAIDPALPTTITPQSQLSITVKVPPKATSKRR
jgi:hypothetical protein